MEDPMKVYTWPELFAVVARPKFERKEGALAEFLRGFPEEHRRLVALALSVAHWHPSTHRQVFDAGDIACDACGLCALYYTGDGPCDPRCPLVEAGYACLWRLRISPWRAVRTAVYPDRNWGDFQPPATVLYEILEGLYAAEYARMEGGGVP